jgi:hypothetical protein
MSTKFQSLIEVYSSLRIILKIHRNLMLPGTKRFDVPVVLKSCGSEIAVQVL